MCSMLTVHYSNGRRQPGISETENWGSTDFQLAQAIAAREAARMWGWAPPDDSVIRKAASELANMMAGEPKHVYSGKPVGEPWNWPAWACFCNWYFWLRPEYREELNKDIRAGDAHKWAHWAMHFQSLCPADVSTDVAYVTGNPELISEWSPGWRRNVPSAPSASQAAALAAVYAGGPPPWAPHPWPIIPMIPGAQPPPIPGMPAPCTPFPDCLHLPFAPCQPIPECLWDYARAVAATSPALAMASGPDGWGVYHSAEITAPPASEPKKASWARPALVIGATLVGLAAVYVWVN